MAKMQARYDGDCYVCGEMIEAGETIDYDRSKGGARHWACIPYTPQPGDIYLTRADGYNGRPFEVGAIERNTNAHIAQGEPEWLVVVNASHEYISRDGMSFGLGDESGYLYHAYARPATPEEAAPVIEQLRRSAEKRAAQRALDALARRVQDEGERPDQAHIGDDAVTLFSKHTGYGYGVTWRVAPGNPGAVWYIQGNSGDGDDWAANNLGGHSIAWRLADPDSSLATELHRLLIAAAAANVPDLPVWPTQDETDETDAVEPTTIVLREGQETGPMAVALAKLIRIAEHPWATDADRAAVPAHVYVTSFRSHPHGRSFGYDWSVVVIAYAAGLRRVWGTGVPGKQVYDATAINAIGGEGAVRHLAPADEQVEAAIAQAVSRLGVRGIEGSHELRTQAVLTSDEVAVQLGLKKRRVQALAESRAVGTRLGDPTTPKRTTLRFSPADVEAMRDRTPGRPRKQKEE